MENSNDINSTQANKVPFDPGWNDPPTFSFNMQQQTTPNRPRLNKRIAFPMSSDSPGPVPPPSTVLPPIPTDSFRSPPVHINPKIVPNEENIEIDSESTLNEVQNILLNFLGNSSELGTKANDIKRRIDVMGDMWSSGRLNKKIHLQMKELAYALEEDRPADADNIHRALMVDYVSVVGTWMPGIKQLIHHGIARSELLAIDKENN